MPGWCVDDEIQSPTVFWQEFRPYPEAYAPLAFILAIVSWNCAGDSVHGIGVRR